MLTVSANIEAEVNAAHTAVVDLFEIDFGDGVYRYWSTHHVDSLWYALVGFGDDQDIQPSSFEARILSVGEKAWKLSADESSVEIKVAYKVSNLDDSVERLILERGIDVFEGAHVKVHRLFPNVKEIVRDYWSGRGNAPRFRENEFDWEISFIPGSLRQHIGRTLQSTCSALFGEGTLCSYNLEKCRGKPQEAVYLSSAAADTNNTTIKGSGFTALKVGQYAFNLTTNTYARITAIASATELSITIIGSGEDGTNTFTAGNQIILGPPFSTCGKTVTDCKGRGRFGAWTVGTLDEVGDKRREFSGRIEPVALTFQGKLPGTGGWLGAFGYKTYSRIPQGNTSLDGYMLPIVYGPYRVYSVKSMYWADAEEFQHGVFYICEGVQFDIANPVIAGVGVDNGYPKVTNLYDVVQNEPFMMWGVWSPSGVEDGRLADEATIAHALRVRRGVGQRAGICYVSRKKVGSAYEQIVIDSYGIGTGNNAKGQSVNCGLPYLFALGVGYGPSFSGMTVARVRIEKEGSDSSQGLEGSFDVGGMLVKMPSNITRYPVIGDAQFTVSAESTTLRFTRYPSYAIAAFDIITNPIYGAGFSENRVDLVSLKELHEFCEEQIGTSVIQTTSRTGTCAVIWREGLITTSILPPDHSLINSKIFLGRGNELYISGNYLFDGPSLVNNSMIPTDVNIPIGLQVAGTMVCLILFDDAIPENKLPVVNSLFSIENYNTLVSKRWVCNGSINTPRPALEAVRDLLSECAADYRMGSSGKIEFVYRRKLLAAEMDTIVAERLFTDRGTARNILRNDNGETTLEIWRKDVTELPNEYAVEFPDSRNNFVTTKVTVFSEEAQIEAVTKFGESGDRKVISKNVELACTTSISQAARRLALMIREEYICNLYCVFSTSLKLGMLIQPGDIIAIDSTMFNRFIAKPDSQVSYAPGIYFFRVIEKQESDKYVITFSCQLWINDIYDDSAKMFDDFFVVNPSGDATLGFPSNVAPSDLTVTHTLSQQNKLTSYINVEITYPPTQG